MATPTWKNLYNILQEYVHKTGRYPEPNSIYNKKPVGSWCAVQKFDYQTGGCKRNVRALLEQLPRWNEFAKERDSIPTYEEEYEEEHNKETSNQEATSSQEEDSIKKKINKASIKKRSNNKCHNRTIGPRGKESWVSSLTRLETYIKEHKHLPTIETEEGLTLCMWCCQQLSEYRTGKLSLSKIEALSHVPMWSWDLAKVQLGIFC